MKRQLTVMSVLSLVWSSFAQTSRAEMGVEEMIFGDIPVVFTASKEEQRITKAPSVISVITSTDIKRQGLRSIEEVLQRVAGYWTTTNFDWAGIASRGLSADTNYHFLLLLDGHSVSSVNAHGIANQYVVPNLANVERIEVIRGPGSTLWGGDAALGIINVITKTGKQVKGAEVSFDYGSRDNQAAANVMLGGELEDDAGNYLVSATYFNRLGWGEKSGNPNQTHGIGAPNSGYRSSTSAPKWGKWAPSLEVYAKAQIGDLNFTARDINWHERHAEQSFGNRRSERNFSDDFLEVSRTKPFWNGGSFETKVFADRIWKAIEPQNGASSNAVALLEVYDERRIGIEATATAHPVERHNLKVGARSERTEIGPNRRLGGVQNATQTLPATNDFYERTRRGTDITTAFYMDDAYELNRQVDLIFGLRMDHNNFREKSTKLLPRAGLIYAPAERWTLKYLFNTGYVRPEVYQSKRIQLTAPVVPNASQSETIESQDLQLLYNSPRTYASLTFFYLTVQDYIVNVNIGGIGGNNNVSNAVSRGMEFEVRQKMGPVVEVYANYSWALAKLTSDRFSEAVTTFTAFPITDTTRKFMNTPRQIYNLGVDLHPVQGVNWNIHARGWRDAIARAYWDDVGAAQNRIFKGEYAVDTALRFDDPWGIPMGLTIYSRNVFNQANKVTLGLTTAGWRLEEPRVIGANLSYKFY